MPAKAGNWVLDLQLKSHTNTRAHTHIQGCFSTSCPKGWFSRLKLIDWFYIVFMLLISLFNFNYAWYCPVFESTQLKNTLHWINDKE